MKTKTLTQAIPVPFIIILLFTGLSFGQSEHSESASGGTSFFRYGMCYSHNPAVLGLKAGPSISLSLPSLRSSIGNNTFSPQYIGDTFIEGEWLYDEDKEDILNQIKSDKIDLFGHASASVLGMTFERYGFDVMNFNFQASGSIPQDIFELTLKGTEEDKSYIFDNVDFESFSYWTTSFYLAKSLFPPRFFEDFAVGATFKYIRGTDYWGLGETNGMFQVTDSTIHTEGLLEYLSSNSGDGMGLDIGVAGLFRPMNAYVGLTAGNLIGSINWSSVEIEEKRFARLEGVHADSIAKSDYMKRFFNETDTTYWAGTFASQLPRYLLLSVYKPSLYLNGQGDIYFSVYQALNETPGYSMLPKLMMGTELSQFKFLLLRMELAVGGIEGFEFGGGFGLDFNNYQFNLTSSWQRGILSGAKGFSINFQSFLCLSRKEGVPRVSKVKPPKKPKVKKPKKEKKPKKSKKVKEEVPVVGDIQAPTPPKDSEALTLADLGLKDMDPGQPLCKRALYPFDINPVFYTQVGKEEYDVFFKDAAIIAGTVIMAKRIVAAIEEGNIDVLGLYGIDETGIKVESPLYTFCKETLPASIQKSRELVTLGSTLLGSSRQDFKGLEARKLPKVIKGVRGAVANLKKVQKELPELIDKLK
ncbi:MAG: hypothetical protein P9X24_19720 [Candidatus Hatepunaea meridiana]|nr:hypothetical protein [Candidatus Hatepunaea meridiana]